MKAHRHSYKSVPPTSRSSANNSQEGNEVNCNGKMAIVVGGGSGIGRATAELFAAQGASVAVADVNKSGAAETAEMLRSSGAQVSEHVCDITRPEQVDLLISEALEAHGHLDIVTSTVGWSDTTFFAQEDEAYWRKIVDINLMGSYWMAQACARAMASGQKGASFGGVQATMTRAPLARSTVTGDNSVCAQA